MTVTIKSVYDGVKDELATADQTASDILAQVGGGGDISPAQMLNVQYSLAQYSATLSIVSAIVKGVGDDIKGVAQKI